MPGHNPDATFSNPDAMFSNTWRDFRQMILQAVEVGMNLDVIMSPHLGRLVPCLPSGTLRFHAPGMAFYS